MVPGHRYPRLLLTPRQPAGSRPGHSSRLVPRTSESSLRQVESPARGSSPPVPALVFRAAAADARYCRRRLSTRCSLQYSSTELLALTSKSNPGMLWSKRALTSAANSESAIGSNQTMLVASISGGHHLLSELGSKKGSKTAVNSGSVIESNPMIPASSTPGDHHPLLPT